MRGSSYTATKMGTKSPYPFYFVNIRKETSMKQEEIDSFLKTPLTDIVILTLEVKR